jgi:hypothetical protein
MKPSDKPIKSRFWIDKFSNRKYNKKYSYYKPFFQNIFFQIEENMKMELKNAIAFAFIIICTQLNAAQAPRTPERLIQSKVQISPASEALAMLAKTQSDSPSSDENPLIPKVYKLNLKGKEYAPYVRWRKLQEKLSPGNPPLLFADDENAQNAEEPTESYAPIRTGKKSHGRLALDNGTKQTVTTSAGLAATAPAAPLLSQFEPGKVYQLNGIGRWEHLPMSEKEYAEFNNRFNEAIAQQQFKATAYTLVPEQESAQMKAAFNANYTISSPATATVSANGTQPLRAPSITVAQQIGSATLSDDHAAQLQAKLKPQSPSSQILFGTNN